MKHCSNILKRKGDSPHETKHKLNHEFIKEITDKISDNLREESDKDIELWTEELKITLNRMRDEGLVSRQEKARFWEESKHYSVGYVAHFVQEWKATLLKKQNQHMIEANGGRNETPGSGIEAVSYREGDLAKSNNSIAFPWNRAYQIENKLQKDLNKKYDTLELRLSGVSIGEVAVMERRPQTESGYIYGLIVKRDSESPVDIEALKEALTQMRDHAVENTIKRIDFPEMELGEDENLEEILREIFNETEISCTIFKRKKKVVNTVNEGLEKMEKALRQPDHEEVLQKYFTKRLDKKHFELITKGVRSLYGSH